MKKYVFYCVCMFFPLLCTEINECSFMLNPSMIPGAGIGVFAVHDIEGGTIIDVPADRVYRILHKDEIHVDFLKMCIAQGNGFYKCPICFSSMEVFWYVNHSDSPNVDMISEGVFVITRDIKKGEEICMDYNQLNEPAEDKEEYYKAKR